jgi:hypothetical protein
VCFTKFAPGGTGVGYIKKLSYQLDPGSGSKTEFLDDMRETSTEIGIKLVQGWYYFRSLQVLGDSLHL